MKGRCLNRLTKGPHGLIPYGIVPAFRQTPRVGLEPTTLRLTAECSTIELSRIIYTIQIYSYQGNSPNALPLSYRGLYFLLRTFKTAYKISHLSFQIKTFFEPTVRTSLRPISNSQLHALLHFHLCPIYLILSKGSWDISS